MIVNNEQLQQAVDSQQEVIEIDGQFDYDLSLIIYPCKIVGIPGSRIGIYSAEENATFSVELNGYQDPIPEEYR